MGASLMMSAMHVDDYSASKQGEDHVCYQTGKKGNSMFWSENLKEEFQVARSNLFLDFYIIYLNVSCVKVTVFRHLGSSWLFRF